MIKQLFIGFLVMLLLPAAYGQNYTTQKDVDDGRLKDYFAKNNIKPFTTQSGLYYVVTQKGTGELAKPGQEVTVNYTGKLLNGKPFDSNTDPKFGHVEPLAFVLGMGQVIQGWDVGVQLLNIGSKATFYIPSSMAYGPEGSGRAIPPNSILIFDVELVDIDSQ